MTTTGGLAMKDATLITTHESLLEYVGTVTIPATTERFVASEKFVRDISHKARVRIGYLGDNFTEWFLGDNGKVEVPIGKQALCYNRLRKESVDELIIAEIGGKAKAETTLTAMFFLMEKQGGGEAGILLNNYYDNIFYIKDSAGVLRAVFFKWYVGGWYVLADSVEHPHWWNDGYRVFFRVPIAVA